MEKITPGIRGREQARPLQPAPLASLKPGGGDDFTGQEAGQKWDSGSALKIRGQKHWEEPEMAADTGADEGGHLRRRFFPQH